VQGLFFGYFIFGLEKKVTRLPAGTGEVEFRFSDFYNTKTAGTRPGRRPPFYKPIKRRQKAAAPAGGIARTVVVVWLGRVGIRLLLSATAASCGRFPDRRVPYSFCHWSACVVG
jgi:hypothetical protein